MDIRAGRGWEWTVSCCMAHHLHNEGRCCANRPIIFKKRNGIGGICRQSEKDFFGFGHMGNGEAQQELSGA